MVEAGLAQHGAGGSRAPLLALRAEARFRLGDLGGARRDLRTVLAGSSGVERALHLARLAMMEAGAEDYWRQQLAELAVAAAGLDRRARAEAAAAAASIALNLGDLDQADRHASTAAALFEELADAGGVARMIDVMAVVVFARGRILEALPRFERAVHLFTELGELVRIVFPRCYLGNCYIQSGRAARGLQEVEAALELARTLDWTEGETFARLHVSMAGAALGSGEQAVREAQHALRLARRLGHREWESVSLRTLGYAHLAAGQVDQAEPPLQEALELAQRLPIHAPWSAAGLALVLTRSDRHQEADDLVQWAISVADRGWPTVRHEVDLARAELMSARADPEAGHVAAEALARAEANGYVLHAARLRELAGGMPDRSLPAS